MKKVGIILASLVGLVIVLLLLVPVFYSADNLRPKIEAAVNEKLRGKVRLGKITLRAFPTLKLHIDETVAEAPAPWNKTPLATIKSIDLKMPIWSLLFSPKVIVQLNEPNILLQQRGEQSNLSAFLPAPPTAAEAAVEAQAQAQAQAAGDNKAVGETLDALPGFVGNRVKAARIDFAIESGKVSVVDEKAPKNSKTEVSDLDVSLQGIGINNPIALNLKVVLDYVSGDTSAKGELTSKGTMKYAPEGKNTRIEIDLQNDLNKLAILQGTLFTKPAGTDFSVNMKGLVNQGEVTNANLESFDLKLGDLIAKASLKVEDATSEARKIDLRLNADNVQLAPFGALVPMVRDYKLAGTVSIKADVQGPALNPNLDVLVQLAQVSGATPQLQKPISNLNGKIEVKGTAKDPAVSIDPFSLKVGVSDLSLKVAVRGLEPMTANVRLSSKRLDVDELMGVQPGKAEPATAGGPGESAPQGPAQPLDETLDKMAPELEKSLANPMLDKTKATFVMDLKSVKAAGAEYTNASLNVSYANRILTVAKGSGLNGYGGRVSFDSRLGLYPKAPTYDFNAALSGVKLQDMVRAHAPDWKDQISGSMIGTMQIAGKGLRKDQLNQNLNGSIKGDVKDGRTSLPIVKIVGGVIQNLPSIGGKKLELPEKEKNKEFKGEFKTLKMVAAIRGRVIQLQDLDINYDTMSAGLGDLQFKSTGTVNFDRQVDIVGTAFLDPSKVRYEPLKGGSGKVELPMKFAGDMSDPKPDYGYTIKIVGPKLAKGALQSAPVQKAMEKLQDKAPEPVKKGIEELRKKFKF